MVQILVKIDDVRRGRKAKVSRGRYGGHRCQWGKERSVRINSADISSQKKSRFRQC